MVVALPSRSARPAATETLMVVLPGRFADGVKTAEAVASSYAVVPESGVPSSAVTFSDEGSMGSENARRTLVLTATFEALFAGDEPASDGAALSAVVKAMALFDAFALPARSFTAPI